MQTACQHVPRPFCLSRAVAHRTGKLHLYLTRARDNARLASPTCPTCLLAYSPRQRVQRVSVAVRQRKMQMQMTRHYVQQQQQQQ